MGGGSEREGWGGEKSQPGGAYNQVFNLDSPITKKEVFKIVEPKLVDKLQPFTIAFVIMVPRAQHQEPNSYCLCVPA